MCAVDWEAIPCWTAWFPAVRRELRVPSACLGDRGKRLMFRGIDNELFWTCSQTLNV